MSRYSDLKSLLDSQIKEIQDKVFKLEWVQENPPKFKYGDKIVVVTKLEENLTLTETYTVKDNGRVIGQTRPSLIIEVTPYFYRKYFVDNGQQLIEFSEQYLSNLKGKGYYVSPVSPNSNPT